MVLISNPESPNESQVWSTPFQGTIGRNVILLPAGSYLFGVSVVAGSPPLAVLLVPFSGVAEVAVLN